MRRKFLRNTNKYIYIILSILIPLNLYVPSDNTLPNILIAIDSSLSMSALDLSPSRSEYIYDLLTKSIINLQNRFTVNTFDTNVHEFGKYISSNEAINQLKKIQLGTGSGLGDALIYNSLLLDNDNDTLILVTDGSANVGFDHHQALDKIRKPIILIAIQNTGYKIATDKNGLDIYIASDISFINKILSDKNNTGIILSTENQTLYKNGELLTKILNYINEKYSKKTYLSLNIYIGAFWFLQTIWLLYIYFRKKILIFIKQ